MRRRTERISEESLKFSEFFRFIAQSSSLLPCLHSLYISLITYLICSSHSQVQPSNQHSPLGSLGSEHPLPLPQNLPRQPSARRIQRRDHRLPFPLPFLFHLPNTSRFLPRSRHELLPHSRLLDLNLRRSTPPRPHRHGSLPRSIQRRRVARQWIQGSYRSSLVVRSLAGDRRRRRLEVSRDLRRSRRVHRSRRRQSSSRRQRWNPSFNRQGQVHLHRQSGSNDQDVGSQLHRRRRVRTCQTQIPPHSENPREGHQLPRSLSQRPTSRFRIPGQARQGVRGLVLSDVEERRSSRRNRQPRWNLQGPQARSLECEVQQDR